MKAALLASAAASVIAHATPLKRTKPTHTFTPAIFDGERVEVDGDIIRVFGARENRVYRITSRG